LTVWRDNIHNVEPISPVDDAFHGSKKRLSAEWWYFDGIFSNKYSFHIGIRTFSRKKLGIVLLFFELYEKEKVILEKKIRYKFKHFETSKKIQCVKIMNTSIMEFGVDAYQKNNQWIYDVNLHIDDCCANLTFTGITEGFKIETNAESWTVALPKAKVTGEIHFNGKKMNVEGIGYHDHNWNYTLLSVLTYGKGWYWGKIKSNSYNIVWANVLKRSGFWDLLSVVNEDQSSFYNINPEKMVFELKKYVQKHRRKLPTQFVLKIDDICNNIPIEVNVTMDVKDIHHSKVLFASYWRYHVQVNGYISVNNNKESIDTIQMMEYLSIF